MKMCLKCLQLYDPDVDGKRCPKMHCNGKVVKIDELMIPVIIKLRQMKYETKFCCQGHIYDVDNDLDTYIFFTSESFKRLIKNNINPPDGWIYKGDCIRPLAVLNNTELLDYSRDFSNEYILIKYKDKYNYVTELMSNLYKWLDNIK